MSAIKLLSKINLYMRVRVSNSKPDLLKLSNALAKARERRVPARHVGGRTFVLPSVFKRGSFSVA